MVSVFEVSDFDGNGVEALNSIPLNLRGMELWRVELRGVEFRRVR